MYDTYDIYMQVGSIQRMLSTKQALTKQEHFLGN